MAKIKAKRVKCTTCKKVVEYKEEDVFVIKNKKYITCPECGEEIRV